MDGDLTRNAGAERPSHVPPGCVVDFDIYNLPGGEHDFFGAWKTLQQPGIPDLVWTPCNGGHWIATRGEDIFAMYADAATYASDVLVVPREVGKATKFIPLQLEPPEHTPYRAAVVKGFGIKHIMALDEPIRELTIETIDSFYDRGHCEFVEEFAEVLPISVFLMLAGLPVSDRVMLRDLGTQLTRPDGTMTPQKLVELVDAYLRPFVTERLADPAKGNDLFSRVLQVPIQGRAWTQDEAERMFRNILLGGLDTVVSMLSFVTHFLAQHPEHRAQLIADPTLIPAAADEFTRRFGTVAVSRELMRDVEIRGFLLKKGDVIQLPVMLHNLDDRSFADAEAVKFDRGITRHATMGNGPHRCVGAALARIEIITFLEEWLKRIPDFALDPEKPATMKGGGVGAMTTLNIKWTPRAGRT